MKEEKFDYRHWKIKDYFEELSSERSTPGGGSGLSLAGATSFSLILMAIKMTLKKEEKKEVLEILEDVERIYLRFLELIEEDSIRYKEFLENKTKEGALKIYEVVEEIALNSLKGIRYIEKIYPLILSSIRSDLVVALELLKGCFYGAKYLCLENLNSLFLEEGEKKNKINFLKALEEEMNFLIEKFKNENKKL